MKYLDNYEKAQRIKRYAKACKRNMLNKPVAMLRTNSKNELIWD